MDIASGSAGSWGTTSTQQMLHSSGLPDAQDFIAQASSAHVPPLHTSFIDPSLTEAAHGTSGSVDVSSGFDLFNYLSQTLAPISLFIQAHPIPVFAAVIVVACITGYFIYRRVTAGARRSIIAQDQSKLELTFMKKNDLALAGASGKQIENFFKEWDAILEGKHALSEQDQKQILLLTKHLMSATILTPAVLKSHLNEMAAIQDRLIAQSFETVRLLKGQIKSQVSDEGLSAKTKDVISQLLLVSEYSIEYRHALDYPSNLKLMSGYYLNPEHWLEKIGLVRSIRVIWGIESETAPVKEDVYRTIVQDRRNRECF